MPFFAKGANWIPADAFVTRISRADYRRLVGDAADANMNMLRLWGGGIWEREEFYEACDERGICLWHDFPFACSTYPGFDEPFLATVRAEAEQNVQPRAAPRLDRAVVRQQRAGAGPGRPTRGATGP